MHRRATAAIPQAALDGSLRDFRAPTGIDFIARTEPFFAWQDLRRTHGLWPYSRSTASAPGARCVAADDDGRTFSGVNFGSQDYLSLSSHPRIKAAAIAMTERYGVHSAGSAALIGNTAASVALESRLSDVLQGRHVVLYPTGWAAGYGAVQGLVRPDDHVVIDILAHSCLQSGTRAATQNIHPHAHLDLESINALNIALQRYEGTVFLVTHDQDLLEEVGTRLWNFEGGSIEDHKGPYEEWLGKK